MTNVEARKIIQIKLVAILLLFIFYGTAAADDPSMLTLKRIYTDKEFELEKFGPIRWLEEGDGYTLLELSPEGIGEDIVKYDCNTRQSSVVVSAKFLVLAGQDTSLQIEDYTWSENRDKLLLFTNAKRVWRKKTRGDYYIFHLSSSKLQKLGGDAEPSTLMFAEFSPDGKRVAYVRENNLYMENIADGSIKKLTSDGNNTIINGTFDWVYEEEFRLRKGFRWSPDGSRIAFWQIDTEGIGIFHMINNTDSVYSKIIPVQYPKTGTLNSSCRIGVIDLDKLETTWFKVPGDPRNNYIAMMEWAESSDEIIFQQLNRQQNTNKVYIGNALTGSVNNIFTDSDEAWVEVVNDLKWLDDGRYFTWLSERDGWMHVYRVSRDGNELLKVTDEDFDVTSICTINDDDGYVYYIASPDNPAERYLYRSRLDGYGKPQRLTPQDLQGTNEYDISPDGRWAVHTHSTMDSPPVIQLVSLPDHKTVKVIADNKKVREKVAGLKRTPTEFFKIEIEDGVTLDAFKILPYNFDESKKYPVLIYVYGEPASHTVKNKWGGSYLWHTMLAQQGYIIISVDNRGTDAPKGRVWRKSIYRQIGILASKDQAAAARIIRKWDYVDSTRIGIWGWSGGGSMSLNAIFRYPELYKTALAIAFISDQRNYDTIYQERYMDTPANNPEGYKYGSPITWAHRLEGNLLIVYGTGDDNCHYQNAEMLFNELIKHNKMFTAVPYPNRTHSIREGENTRRHLYETLTWYLTNNLPAGPVN